MIETALILLMKSLLLTLRLAPSGSFPRPLSREEERECLERWADGDLEARNKLVEHNLRLVAHIMKKYYAQSDDLDDLLSIGTIGLIKAVNTFSPDRNIKLATYASRCIENEILMFLRKTSQSKYEISIEEPLSTDWDGNELLLSDVLGSDSDTVSTDIEQEVEINQLMEAVSKLNTREAMIMELRFGLNGNKEHTQKQVADLLGISQSYISRLEKRIIRKLKEDLEKVI